MENFDINALDVKTLRLLIAIHKTGSVSAAAEQRGMTQSTASYGLEKLRQSFGDPIFSRVGRGMAATPIGAEIIGRCQEILDQLDQLSQLHVFDPVTAMREFTIGTAGFETETVIVPFSSYLFDVAPNVALTIHGQDLKNLEKRLEDDWDISLIAYQIDSSHLKGVRLFEDHYVTYYDQNVRSAPENTKAYAEAPHAVTMLGGKKTSFVDKALKEVGLSRRVALAVNQFENLPQLMKGTPMIATLPSKFADSLMRDFQFIPCPINMPKLSVQMVWHQRKDADPAHIWLRNEIKSFVKKHQVA
ncbi:LysR family transcriptional regulator [Terasakiella sp. A23]|uniref:LysR family transcriptional regulator n=1 Tax=Terasakiella sp. FCG-A23 TaxID=3080561 RepID=UPI0029536525|nr:LysR family transcriptional regulator [Terasakiella sp. A23]MDV7338370.1 LysR family transcriptional regulator [Terasakiella sp. A23]